MDGEREVIREGGFTMTKLGRMQQVGKPNKKHSHTIETAMGA